MTPHHKPSCGVTVTLLQKARNDLYNSMHSCRAPLSKEATIINTN